MSKLVLLLMMFTFTGSCDAGNKFAGPFDALLREMTDCEDKGNGDVIFENAIMRKKSRTLFTCSMKVILNKTLTDEETTVRLSTSVWGNGGWRPNYMTTNYGKACTSMGKILPGFYDKFMEAANRTSCPIPPGSYQITDAPGTPEIIFPSLPYNKYKVFFKVLNNNGVLLGCQGVIVDVVPKEHKRG